MLPATLRLNDGRSDTSPQLRKEVQELQGRLNALGSGLAIDGIFGAETDTAVRRFQREHGLYEDGVVGPRTWNALSGNSVATSPSPIITSYSATDPAMLLQLSVANRYQTDVQAALTGISDLTESVVAGIASRESGWGRFLRPPGFAGTGDFTKRPPTSFRSTPLPPDGGFGRGLMQIDYDADAFARTGPWDDPAKNIAEGVKVLTASHAVIARKATLSGMALLCATIAAYNCGPNHVLDAIRDGRDVDFYTTQRNYSRDVLDRAGFFQLHGWA
jgi:hypothetical protein